MIREGEACTSRPGSLESTGRCVLTFLVTERYVGNCWPPPAAPALLWSVPPWRATRVAVTRSEGDNPSSFTQPLPLLCRDLAEKGSASCQAKLSVQSLPGKMMDALGLYPWSLSSRVGSQKGLPDGQVRCSLAFHYLKDHPLFSYLFTSISEFSPLPTAFLGKRCLPVGVFHVKFLYPGFAIDLNPSVFCLTGILPRVWFGDRTLSCFLGSYGSLCESCMCI